MKKSKEQSLKELQSVWYQKLRETGFKDIETEDGRLSVYSSSRYKNRLAKESQAEYYRLAGQFFYSHRFESLTHKQVWKLHSEGLTNEKIAERLKIAKHKAKYIINGLRKECFGEDYED